MLGGDNTDNDGGGPPTLVLPTGSETYKSSVWIDSDMHKIRERYTRFAGVLLEGLGKYQEMFHN